MAYIRAIANPLGVARNLVVAVTDESLVWRNLVVAMTDGKTFGRASGQWSVAEQPCPNTRALLVKVKENDKQLCALKIMELNGVAQAS